MSSPQKKGHSFAVRGSPHCWSRRTLWTLRRSGDSCQHEGRVRGDAGHWENKKRRLTKSHSTAIELEDIWTRKGGTCQRLRLPGCRNCFVSNISHSLASHDNGSQCQPFAHTLGWNPDRGNPRLITPSILVSRSSSAKCIAIILAQSKAYPWTSVKGLTSRSDIGVIRPA